MRIIFFVLALVAVSVGGYFFYQNAQDSPGMTDRPAPAPLPTAEACLTENAVYEYNDDRRLMLRFRRVPPPNGAEVELAAFEGGQPIGNMAIVVTVTSFGTEYVFNPVNQIRSGAQYESNVTFWRPTDGGAPVQTYLFDSTMHYSGHQLRNDSPAPGYIFMPGLLPRLYRDRIDQPAGVFRFQACETPAAAPTAP